MAGNLKSLLPAWIQALTPYPPGKPIDELEREYGITGAIKLASNENPLGPSRRAIEAVRGALAAMHRYPDGGTFYLRRRLAAKLQVRPEELIIGNGSNEIIELAVRAFVRPGDEVVMADQTFVIYRIVVQAAGGTARIVPLTTFTHDLQAMLGAVTRRTRLIFLANPSNPTGTIYTRAAWEKFLEKIPPEVVIVADDAYAEFVDDPDYPDSLRYQADGRLLLTLRTFSKIYGLAGVRVGYGVSRTDLIDALDRVRQPFNVNALAQVAATAALDDDEHVARTREVTREGMTFLRGACDRLRLSTVPSWANFLLIQVGNGAVVYEALLRQGVIVRPMDVYGFPNHIRVTIGTMEENRRFAGALERVLGEGGPQTGRAAGRRATGAEAIPGAPGAPLERGSVPARQVPLFEQMTVIGVGLIGGSLALAARQAGLVSRVIGCGRSAENLRVARERGLIDVATQDPGEAVKAADLVVLAVPVGELGRVAEAIRPHLRQGTVVTDAISVKADVVARLEPLCHDVGCLFVGGHPIAGSEQAGAGAAAAGLFRGHRCILTPTPATDPAALQSVRAMWEGVGMQVETMDAATHDTILARVSHVPHLVAYALAAAVGEAQAGTRPVLAYAGSGFRDTTRIAASSPALWREITIANRVQVLRALDEFSSRLQTLGDLIRREDGTALERALAEARERRRSLGRDEGG